MNGAQLKLILDKLDRIIELLEKQEADKQVQINYRGVPDLYKITQRNGPPPTDAVTISKREL